MRLSSTALIFAWLLAAGPQTPSLAPAPLTDTAPSGGERLRFSIASSILGETRHVFVALPASFARTGPARRYPLIVVLDGEGHSATTVVDASRELSRNGLMPDAVVVGIENTNRLRDLTPPGLSVSGSSLTEGGDRFLDFLERELIPAIDARFRTAAPRVLVGHSSGGILATYAGATRVTFRLIVALDAPTDLGDNWLVAKMVARAKKGGDPLRYASYNAVYGWTDASWRELAAAAPASWKLRHEKFQNETHNSMTLLGAYLGLRELFTDYSRKAAPVYPTTSILPYYERLSAGYGGSLVPPENLMRDVVEDLLMEGRGAGARAAFDAFVAAYGEPRDAAARRMQIAEVERQPAPTETVESLLATPLAAPATMAAYLGEWEGETRIGENHRGHFSLNLSTEAGRMKGVVTWRFAPGEELKQEIQYLTVQPDGFTYGFMNGMRPRGMLLYVMKGSGNQLDGMMRWGGVKRPSFEGEEAPQEFVTLKRVR
jgi:hypothetical protein